MNNTQNNVQFEQVAYSTSFGNFKGRKYESYYEFLGIPFATAGRFEYAKMIENYPEPVDATQYGPACPQTRGYYQHFEVPARAFYYKEYREGLTFQYAEDCLNLNIYTPGKKKNCPVIVFIHGGGFDSGASSEFPFDGENYAKRGVVMVVIQYRVGVLGYLTNEEIFAANGREGNFGLDDQFTAIKWVKAHISEFGGDPENITLMGQSAGAISIQYLSLSEKCRGLFKHAIMMSGGGLFPKFSLPRRSQDTRGYWKQYMEILGCKTLSELKKVSVEELFAAIEKIKELRKDGIFNTMPVVDGYLVTAPIDELIKHPLPIDYMLGYTNNDMYAILMGIIEQRYAKANNGYIYYFDIDAPGTDKNGAFHSSDLVYAFGRTEESFRPYTEEDEKVSEAMIDYFCSFAQNGNPNHEGAVEWKRLVGKALRIRRGGFKMVRPSYAKLLWNTITKGDPK